MTSPRRSERIQQNCSYAPALDENSDETSNFSQDIEQREDSNAEMLYTPHRAGPKRQKVEHTGSENTREGQMVEPRRPDKYVRGRRGYLKLMTEMPLDTLYEIFRQLDPLDLLHLSWASKSLHGIVMGKSFSYIWEEAYARLYESENPPPRCPKDVNPAQYARFLYHQKCMVCNTRIGAYTSWMMRLRACKHCLGSDLFTGCRDTTLLTITAKRRRYVWTSDLEKAKDNSDCSERLKLVNDRMEGIWEFNLWKIKCSKHRTDDRDQRRAKRSIAIFKKLEEIGWTESNIREINDGQLPDDLPGFGTVKKLTKHDWKGIRPKIESVLSEMKENHLEALRIKHLNNRWDQFEKSFREWDKAQTLDKSFRPRAGDILVMEPFFTTIFISDTEGAEFELADIDHAAKEWIEWRNDFVFSVLPPDLQDRYRANKSPLPPLAIFYFSIPTPGGLHKICGCRESLRCCVPRSSDERKIYDAIIRLGSHRLGLYPGPWKWFHKNLEFDQKRFQVTSEILEYLEMDPYTTTLAQLGECKQRLACLQCEPSWRCGCEGMIRHEMCAHYQEGKEGPLPFARWTQTED